MKDLPHGYGVGYHDGAKDGAKKVVLYDPEGTPLSHVEFKSHEGGEVSLHTRTLSGETGGQGHLGAMFPTALQVLHDRFSATHDRITMVPAVGAATKGLISNLTRARESMGPAPGAKNAANFQTGQHFLRQADDMRRRRKAAAPKKPSGFLGVIGSLFAKKPEKTEAQAWNPALMQETGHELDALRHMEMGGSTGLQITGVAQQSSAEPEGLYEPIVGPATPMGYQGSGARWLHAGSKAVEEKGARAVPTLQLQMGMVHLPGYIRALKRQEAERD